MKKPTTAKAEWNFSKGCSFIKNKLFTCLKCVINFKLFLI